MTKEPKLPHRLKWGAWTAAKADEVDYLIGIRLVGYASLKDVFIAEVPESVANEVDTWRLPDGKLKGAFGGDVFVKRPRAGAYYKYVRLKDIVYEES